MPRTGAGSTRGPASRRGRRDLTRFVLWHSFLDSSCGRFRPTQLLAGVGGCPGPHTVRWKWRSGLLVPLHDPVGVYEHYCSTEESCWSLCAALSCQSSCHDVMWHVSFCPLTLTTATNWLESEHPKASLVTGGPKANAWWGKGRASHACGSIILQLLYHN